MSVNGKPIVFVVLYIMYFRPRIWRFEVMLTFSCKKNRKTAKETTKYDPEADP